MGLVTATYRSRDMAQRFKIEAVHIHTSTASQIRHQISPKVQTCNINGIFYIPPQWLKLIKNIAKCVLSHVDLLCVGQEKLSY